MKESFRFSLFGGKTRCTCKDFKKNVKRYMKKVEKAKLKSLAREEQ